MSNEQHINISTSTDGYRITANWYGVKKKQWRSNNHTVLVGDVYNEIAKDKVKNSVIKAVLRDCNKLQCLNVEVSYNYIRTERIGDSLITRCFPNDSRSHSKNISIS